MPNLRIIYDNAADRSATLTATSTAGTLAASNMLTEYKGQVHRSVGTSVTYTLTWNTVQTISSVVLPCTNLTANAQVRVKTYSDTAGTALIKDTGVLNPVQATSAGLSRWGGVLSSNTFAYGGYTKAIVWLNVAGTSTRRCDIVITDTTNPAGYIDCSRIIAGTYWSPKYNLQNGFVHSISDTSTVSRSESGDSVAYVRPVYDTLSFNYALIPDTDRPELLNVFRTVGSFKNIFISLLPATDTETDVSIYGKLRDFSYTQRLYGYYDSSVEVESW